MQSVRQGKLFEVSLDAGDAERARTQLDDLCAKLLANPVIEDYEVVRVED